MSLFQYVLEGTPIPLKRPRFGKGRVFNAQASLLEEIGWSLKYQHMAQKQTMPLSGPLYVEALFLMPVPSSTPKKKRAFLYHTPHTKRIDIDNLCKLIFDAGNGILWNDDSQIYSLKSYKVYAQVPKTILYLHDASDEDGNGFIKLAKT